MNFWKGVFVIVVVCGTINYFTTKSNGSVDGIQFDHCKDRKCINCDAFIGCYGYKWNSQAGIVVGPDNSLKYCKTCADSRIIL